MLEENRERLSRKIAEACERFLEWARAHDRYRLALSDAFAVIDEKIEDALATLEIAEEDKKSFKLKMKRRHRKRARELLADNGAMNDKPASMVIRTGTGTGKTYHIKKAFEKVRPGAVDIFFPTMEMCLQNCDPLNQTKDLAIELPRSGSDPYYDMVKKTNYTDEDYEQELEARKKGFDGFNCMRHLKAEIMANAGISVISNLCRTCDLKEQCGYFRQKFNLERTREHGGLLVRTHHRLTSSSLTEFSSIKVIDESIISSCISSISMHRGLFEVETLMALIDPWEFTTETRRAVVLLCRIIDAIEAAPDRPLDTIFDATDDLAHMGRLCAQRAAEREKKLDAHHRAAEDLAIEIDQQGIRPLKDLATLIDQIVKCHRLGIDLATVKFEDDKGPKVKATVFKPPRHVKETDSLLILDASFRPELIKLAFPNRDFEVVQDDDEDLNIDVTFIDEKATGYALGVTKAKKSDAEKAARKGARSHLIKAAHDIVGDNALLVSRKDMIRQFKKDGLPPSWDTVNFGNLRGRNDWQTLDGVVIIGQAVASVRDLERHCAAMTLAANGRAIYTVDQYYRDMGEKPSKFSLFPLDEGYNYFHPDPLVWEYINSQVHDEYMQAIGRVRANRGNKPKKVVLISNFFPDQLKGYVMKQETMRFEELNSWTRYLIESMAWKGFAVRSYTYAANMMGDNPKIIEQAIRRSTVESETEAIYRWLNALRPFKSENKDPSSLEDPSSKYGLYVKQRLSQGLPATDLKGLKDPSPQYIYSLWGEGSLVHSCPIRWGKTGQRAILFHNGQVPADVLENEIPGLKLFDEIPDADRLTILECQDENAVATKGFSWEGDWKFRQTFDYNAGTFFNAYVSTKLEGIGDLARVLKDIEKNERLFVIRGKVVDGMMSSGIRRTSKKRGAIQPFFEDHPRHWVMFDIDKAELPAGISIRENPEYAAQTVLRMFPKPFNQTTAFISMSSSCGLHNDHIFKGHVWFWLTKAMNSHQVLEWIKDNGNRVGKTRNYILKEKREDGEEDFSDNSVEIDTSVLTAVQPHFTANPIFEAPLPPFGERSWLSISLRESIDIEAVVKKETFIRHTERHQSATLKGSKNYMVSLELACLEIGDGLKGFNEGILSAARQAAAAILNDMIDDQGAYEIISGAVYRADPGDRTEEQIERYASADFISDKVEWWKDALINGQG